jgi:hypothetical protein
MLSFEFRTGIITHAITEPEFVNIAVFFLDNQAEMLNYNID